MQRFDFPIQSITLFYAICYFFSISFKKFGAMFEILRTSDFDAINKEAKGFEIVHGVSPCRGTCNVARKASYAN